MDNVVLNGLIDFCNDNHTEIKNEGASQIFRVPSFVQNDATGYFFTNANILVLTTDAQKIDQIISENSIEASLGKIQELS